MRKTPVIPTAYTPPTYSDAIADASAALDTEMMAAGFPWSSSVRYSLPWVLARVWALAVGTVHRFGSYIASGILPSTARDLNQLRLFGEERGIMWLAGQRYSGLATVATTTAETVTLPAGSIITLTAAGPTAGLRYLTTTATEIVSPTTQVAITAEFIGDLYNVPLAGGRISNPPTGIEASCLVTATTGGYNEETIEEYRTRLLDAIQRPPEGGAVADWQNWTREMLEQNVDGVWVYGPGAVVPASVDPSGYVQTGNIAILYSLDGVGTDKIPDAGDLSDMAAWLNAHPDRPVTALPKAFAPTDNNVPMTLRCHASSGAVAGSEITALQSAVRQALADMLDRVQSAGLTPGAMAGSAIRNSAIHGAIATVPGIDWHEITSLDGGSGAADIATTHTWELTRFTTTFVWV